MTDPSGRDAAAGPDPSIGAVDRQREYRGLLRNLRCAHPRIRTRAAEALAEYGPRASEPLCRALRDDHAAVRRAAARSLGRTGAGGVEELCRALKDPDPGVRLAAVESLGAVGDGRAVGALREALHAAFLDYSPRRQVGLAVALLAACLLIEVALLLIVKWPPLLITNVVVTMSTGGLAGAFIRARCERSRISEAVARSMARIVERDPAPEMWTLVSELRAIAADRIQQERAARAASRTAAERIAALTERTRSLPIAGAAPHTGADSLPRAAGSAAPGAERLPLPGE